MHEFDHTADDRTFRPLYQGRGQQHRIEVCRHIRDYPGDQPSPNLLQAVGIAAAQASFTPLAHARVQWMDLPTLLTRDKPGITCRD